MLLGDMGIQQFYRYDSLMDTINSCIVTLLFLLLFFVTLLFLKDGRPLLLSPDNLTKHSDAHIKRVFVLL